MQFTSLIFNLVNITLMIIYSQNLRVNFLSLSNYNSFPIFFYLRIEVENEEERGTRCFWSYCQEAPFDRRFKEESEKWQAKCLKPGAIKCQKKQYFTQAEPSAHHRTSLPLQRHAQADSTDGDPKSI